MNQTFAEPVQKIDALLTHTLAVPAELSSQFCAQLNEAPQESQQVALEIIGKKALELKQEKEKTLQKIRSIKTQMKSEFEKSGKIEAEENLEKALKDL